MISYVHRMLASAAAMWKRGAVLLTCMAVCHDMPALSVCRSAGDSIEAAGLPEATSTPEKKKKRGNIFVRFFKNFTSRATGKASRCAPLLP